METMETFDVQFTPRMRVAHDLKGADFRSTGYRSWADQEEDETKKAELTKKAERFFIDAQEIQSQFWLLTMNGIA